MKIKIGRFYAKQSTIEAIIQYFLIYIMIQYVGGRVLALLGTDIFYGGTIILCIVLVGLFSNRIYIEKDFMIFIVVLGSSLMLSFTITGGALGIGTILSILSRFLLVYVAIRIDSEAFLDRFIKFVFFLASISLIEFIFVQIVGSVSAQSIFSHLYEIRNEMNWLGSSYGLFFICYNFMDPSRNAYMFGEPGEYQGILIAALYFMTFFDLDFEKKKKITYYIVILITLLTTQSTTGYFNLIALVIAVLLVKRKKINPFVRKIFVIATVILCVYMVFFFSESSFLYRNFFAKIMSDHGAIDLAASTGAARVGPIEQFVETVQTVPHRLIFGVGFNGLSMLPLRAYTTCGLINSVAMIGLVSSLILYGKMLEGHIRESNSWVQLILGIFIVVNIGLSQPDILFIISVLICMYGTYKSKL